VLIIALTAVHFTISAPFTTAVNAGIVYNDNLPIIINCSKCFVAS